MNLRWGVMPFRLDFEADPEKNIDRTFRSGPASALLMLCFKCHPAHAHRNVC